MTFPMRYDFYSGWYGPTNISHPRRNLILTNLVAGLIFTGIPLIIILAMQVFVRSFWDANAALFALFQGLAIM